MENDKIQVFLQSDILERYILGTTSADEKAQTEIYIALYPEVQSVYEELQENLENYAKSHALKTPEDLKNKILKRVKAERIVNYTFMRYAAAASIIAMILAGSSYFFWNQNQRLQLENTLVTNKIETLEKDMRNRLEDVRNQFIVLNNPKTKKITIKGNKKARDLKAIAYINPIKKLSYINIDKLPNLPENQCYQMWAEVNGKMINLGIIEEARGEEKLLALPYAENAISYITIEQKGGTHTPNVANIVANIAY